MIQSSIKTGLAAVLLGAAILQGGTAPALAAAESEPAVLAAPSANYGLTDSIRAAVKNASAVPTERGTRIAVTVRLYNGGDTPGRVPEHELRVRTRSGISYALASSTGNKTALQPKEISELVYVTTVDSREMGGIDQVSFVHVNLYAFPKEETELLAIPLGSVWYGAGDTAPAKPERLDWGGAFLLPGINSSIRYTAAEAEVQQANGGRAAVVTLKAENTGGGRETIPAFRIDAWAGRSGFEGVRSASDPAALEPGETAYLHYVIPLDKVSAVTELFVVSTDTFAGNAGQPAMTIPTGKLILSWPAGGSAASGPAAYEPGKPIAFDPLTKAVGRQTEVSLMEFKVHKNPEDNYQTAVAKFRFTNRSSQPAAVPVFGSVLTNGQGVSYRGARQVNGASVMNPGLSYAVSYSYVLPQTEEAEAFTMKLADQTAVSPYTATVAALSVRAGTHTEGASFSMYPFEVKLNDVQVNFMYNAGVYYYKFHLDLDIQQTDTVVADNGFSQLRFEVVDNAGRIIGSKDAAMAGAKKLVSGKQVLEAGNLSSDQLNTPFSVNVYEVFETESGTAKRLLKHIK